MTLLRRQSLIRRIENARDSRVLVYITSTRPGLDESMAMEAVRRIYDHLQGMQDENIDLFLCSNGGDAVVPWRLVNLIRECTGAERTFGVLIPHRAFSAATLTALGADEIVMHRMGVLGPTDPSVKNLYNPRDDNKRLMGINVEDVNAYLQLVKDAGIQHQDELVQAFNVLAEKVHPLALGNVQRFLLQSRMMAKKILSLPMKGTPDEHKIADLVDAFTSKLYYHGHPINRTEAQELGLSTIRIPPARLERAMWSLYLEYEREMKLETDFDTGTEFVQAFPNLKTGESGTTPTASINLTFIESTSHADVKQCEYQIFGEKQKDGSIQYSTNVLNTHWTKKS